MQTRKEIECGVMLGKTYWKVLKFVVNRISKDAYLILPIPDVGLHLSIHSPKPPTFSNWLIQARSRKELGIEEKVEVELSPVFLREYLSDVVDGFMDAFRICSPTNEEVLVMPPNFFNCFAEFNTGNKQKAIVDLGQMLRAMSTGTFYRTRVKHLPHLLREVRLQNPSYDRDLGIFGVSDNKIVIPITSKRMLEFDHHQLTENLGNTCLIGTFFDPMQRAIERVKAIRPDVFRERFQNGIAKDLHRLVKSLKSSKPRFVDFP